MAETAIDSDHFKIDARPESRTSNLNGWEEVVIRREKYNGIALGTLSTKEIKAGVPRSSNGVCPVLALAIRTSNAGFLKKSIPSTWPCRRESEPGGYRRVSSYEECERLFMSKSQGIARAPLAVRGGPARTTSSGRDTRPCRSGVRETIGQSS